MAEPPRDPLAEHPLGGEAPRQSAKGKTLSLFPDLGEAPLRKGAAEAAPPSPAPPAPGADAPEPLPEAEEVPEGEEAPVAFARRLTAGLADLLILALVGAVELAAGSLLLELRFPLAAFAPLGAFLFLVALVLLVLAPFVWGTTPGMALADLRIRAEDGGSPTLAASSLRFLGFLLTGLLAGVPLLLAAFDRRGRTLADLFSGTTVVSADRHGA
ncbi:MAG TPA: RDD family protein [Thermoanaerobaculia bacterium]|nr:RDD family protein [Thermoanaerobaculia bacterium]HQR67621.1 RDD family protein [Thermoanaerobaculia bacterium]